MTEYHASTAGVPQNVFTLPTPIDITLTPFWSTVLQKDNFLLQKSSSPGNPIFKSLFSTIASVFDTKLPPYRILFQRDVNTMCLQVAVAESDKAIDAAWFWIEKNIMPELDTIDNPFEKEKWVAEKIHMIVTAIEYGSDELSSDENVRNASRTFRQIFDIPHSERFVSYYSCAYKGRQGWLYMSENYIGFHSFLLGAETKILIELKDIQELKKEKSKGIFDDSLRIITKDKEEYPLSNMFKRDEVYDLLIQLTGQAMQKWLKNAGGEAPGQSNDADFIASEIIHQRSLQETSKITDSRSHHQLVSPLKHDLAARKRDQAYHARFRLPATENLIKGMDATYSKDACPDRDNKFYPQVPPGQVNLLGRVYLSQNFLAFESQERLPAPQQHLPVCKAVLPLYTIKRVERMNSGAYTSGVVVTTCHKMEHEFLLHAEKIDGDQFCETLKSLLLKQVPTFKRVKPFMATCESEQLFKTDSLVDTKIHVGGLGMDYGYPENSKRSKDKSKTKLWKLYFQENGRNLTMVKLPTFGKLVRVGLPNSLRGEIWEAASGAMYLRFANPGVYHEILEKYKDQASLSTEEIEKDLNRSLPEYPGYQSTEGINRLRRVLTAYAWKNPELGYCQAMNIVVSALLIYTTEEQAFWILHILVDRMCPGYYSTNMYGALLDQITFEQLVEKTMPLLWSHFKKTNVELSVACLPWFLSLYINSMPLEFAVRVLDILFMEGPRILFQIGLAILKINGEELLQTRDDGAFLDILKNFFHYIGQLEENGRHTKLTKFNEVMLTAYREFSLVTEELVIELRSQNQLKVGAGIESFTKRTVIRHLDDMATFNKEEIGILYDKFFAALYYANHEVGGKPESKMDRETFGSMLASMTSWAKKVPVNDSPDEHAARDVRNSFLDRLYNVFVADAPDHLVDFQHAVLGMSEILHGDLMSHMDWFFDLYDEDRDGILRSNDIVNMSKELYWLLSILKDTDIAWDAVTSLVVHSCEQSDIAKGDQPDEATLTHRLADLTMTADGESFHGRIKQLQNALLADIVDITLPSFRMVVLTNESLEMLFDHGFTNSFKLVKSAADRQKSLGRELFENLFADGQKLAKDAPKLHSPISKQKSTASLNSSPSGSPSSGRLRASSTASMRPGDQTNEELEVDTLMDEWVHFDV